MYRTNKLKTCGRGQSTVFIIAHLENLSPCISHKEKTGLVQLAELPDSVHNGHFLCTLQLHPLTRVQGDSQQKGMVMGLAGKDKILFKAGVTVESPCTVHIFWHFRFTGHAVHSTNNQ